MTHCLCSMMIMLQNPGPQPLAQPPFKHVKKKIQLLLHLNHLSRKSPALENVLPNDYRRQLQVTLNITMMSLVDVIPWIRYEAQNMAEWSFRQELQCIRETKHLQYIIVMIVLFKLWKQDQGWWPSIPTCSFHLELLQPLTSKQGSCQSLLKLM